MPSLLSLLHALSCPFSYCTSSLCPCSSSPAAAAAAASCICAQSHSELVLLAVNLLTWSLPCSLAPISYSPEALFCQACILCQLNAAKTKLAALAFCIPEAPRDLLDYLRPFRVEKPKVSPDPLSPLGCSRLRRQTASLGSNIGTAPSSTRNMTQQALSKPVGMHISPLMRTDADIGPSKSKSSSTAATTSRGADTDRNLTSKQADNMHASTGRRQVSNTKIPRKAQQPSQPVSSSEASDVCDVLAGLKANKAVPSCDAHSACHADLTGKALAADAAWPPTASTHTKAPVLSALAAAEVEKAHRVACPTVGFPARQAGKAKNLTKSTSADWASASSHEDFANTTVRTAPKPSQSAFAGQASDAADAFAAPFTISKAIKAEMPNQQPECTGQASASCTMSAAAEPDRSLFTGEASDPAASSLLDTVSKANTVQETARQSACTDNRAIANASIRLDVTKQAHKGKPSASRKTSASAAEQVSKLEGLSRSACTDELPVACTAAYLAGPKHHMEAVQLSPANYCSASLQAATASQS